MLVSRVTRKFLDQRCEASTDPVVETPRQIVEMAAVAVDVTHLEIASSGAVLFPVRPAPGPWDLIGSQSDYGSALGSNGGADLAPQFCRTERGPGREELPILVSGGSPEW